MKPFVYLFAVYLAITPAYAMAVDTTKATVTSFSKKTGELIVKKGGSLIKMTPTGRLLNGLKIAGVAIAGYCAKHPQFCKDIVGDTLCVLTGTCSEPEKYEVERYRCLLYSAYGGDYYLSLKDVLSKAVAEFSERHPEAKSKKVYLPQQELARFQDSAMQAYHNAPSTAVYNIFPLYRKGDEYVKFGPGGFTGYYSFELRYKVAFDQDCDPGNQNVDSNLKKDSGKERLQKEKDDLLKRVYDKLSEDEIRDIINNYYDGDLEQNCNGDYACSVINEGDKHEERPPKRDEEPKKDKPIDCKASSFHRKVCDWIDWTQGKYQEDKDTKIDIKDGSADFELNKDRIQFTAQCPPPKKINIHFSQINVQYEISYQGLCDAFITLKPFLLGLSGIHSAMIIAGRRD